MKTSKDQFKPKRHFPRADRKEVNENKENSTVYISNLRYDRTEKSIKKLFENYGEVIFVKVVIDNKTKKSKGIAFVQMKSPYQAKQAILGINDKILDGRTAKASIARPKKAKFYQTKDSDPKRAQAPKIKTPKKRKTTALNKLLKFLGQN